MTQERVVEVELSNETVSEVADAVTAVVDETVRLFDSLGKAIVNTVQDVSNLMVIKVDAQTREHLDMLVDTGAAKSRRKAAQAMIAAGLAATEPAFERIRQTKQQIAGLRQQMRALVQVDP